MALDTFSGGGLSPSLKTERENTTTNAVGMTAERARLRALIDELDDLVSADARALVVQGAAAMLEKTLRHWRRQNLGAGALVRMVRDGGPTLRPEIDRSPVLERMDAWKSGYEDQA